MPGRRINNNNNNPAKTSRAAGRLVSPRGLGVWILLLTLGGLAFLAARSRDRANASPSFVVTGYVPEYRLEHVQKHLDVLAQSVDELILFSVQPTAAGGVSFDVGLSAAQISSMVEAARAHGIARVLLCLGGGGRSSHFAAVTRTPELRARLVQSLLTLCTRHGLAGIDLDWEAPAHRAQMQDYASLIVDMKREFGPRGLLVTVALHAWQSLPREAAAVVDRVHVMAYDQPGEHSTFANAKVVIRDKIQSGLQASQLALGIPAYGRGVANPQDARTYADISRAPGFLTGADTTADGVYYNGPPTVRAKTGWSRLHGLAGVVFWELGQDNLETPGISLVAAAAASSVDTHA